MIDFEKSESVLRKNRLFRKMSDVSLACICKEQDCFAKHFSRDEVIYDTDDFERAVCIILSGRAAVFKDCGAHRTLINMLGCGSAFGVASLFGDVKSYVTTIIADSDCEIIFFPHYLCEKIIRNDSDFAIEYISFLSDRIRFLNEKISSYTAPCAGAKLAGYLLSECGISELNMKQLAQSLDIGRASLYRELDLLADAGIIEKNGRSITVRNKSALEDILNQGKNK